ncbi:MAG: ubiquitin-like small modifier protein 1 [Chloroflexota bacterium]|nr:ubiquitin-like small modifier protein 1 [Chloroflexota bacterium]|tara:strand:- start:58 stop:339 length:282 start_codon:yes stop_codon:yes gene_type:complete
MAVTVRIPAPLRKVTNDKDRVEVDAENLADMVQAMEEQYPGIKERLLDEAGELRHFVNIYVNGEDVQFLDGLETAISESDEVSIVPAVAGGLN